MNDRNETEQNLRVVARPFDGMDMESVVNMNEAGMAIVDEADADALLVLESMSRMACAMIFQSARDMVCAHRALRRPIGRSRESLAKHSQRLEEIQLWAKTVYPLRYDNGGMSLAGAIAIINLYTERYGARQIEYHVVRDILLTAPDRLAIVDHPLVGMRTIDSLSTAVSTYLEDRHAADDADAVQGALEFA